MCRRLVCHSPFKKWISFLYLRLGRLPPWPSWEDVKASMAECFRANYPDIFIDLGCHKSCAPKFAAVWPCSQALFFLQEPYNAEGLDWYFPKWLNPLCQWVVEWAHQRLRAGDQEHHDLSFKKNFIITFTSSVTFQLFFFFAFWLPSFVACWFAWLLHKYHVLSFKKKKKKNSNHRIHKHCSLSIPLFVLTSFVFADSDGWFTSIMFSFIKLFSSHLRALLLSFTFLFQRHLRFFGK